jgi:phage terminase large subunit-like protein
MDEQIWSRRATLPLNTNIGMGQRDRNFVGVDHHVKAVREQALQRVEKAIEKLEQTKGQRAIERLYETRFSVSAGKPCVTVVVTFVLISPEK